MRHQILHLPVQELSECMNEDNFIPTNFDAMIEEYMETIIEEGGQPINLSVCIAEGKIFAVIQYIDSEEMSIIQSREKFALPKLKI